MIYALAFLLLVTCFIVSDTLLELKIKKLEKEIIAKESVIGAFAALDKAISKLNNGFKDHERRIDNIEKLIGKCISSLPEKPEEPIYTCKDCKFYHPCNGIGFTDAINLGFSNGITYFKCEKMGCSYPIDCDGTCQLFEKEESLDEDENVVYANNVKINISSNEPRVYMADGLLTSEELVDRIRTLYLDGGISFADAQIMLERLKQ